MLCLIMLSCFHDPYHPAHLLRKSESEKRMKQRKNPADNCTFVFVCFLFVHFVFRKYTKQINVPNLLHFSCFTAPPPTPTPLLIREVAVLTKTKSLVSLSKEQPAQLPTSTTSHPLFDLLLLPILL